MIEFVLGYASGVMTILVLNWLAGIMLDRYFEERE